jgi:hypothetical protein
VIDNPSNYPEVTTGILRITASYLETASGMIGQIDLSDMGENGKEVSNFLWRISDHLRKRADGK